MKHTFNILRRQTSLVVLILCLLIVTGNGYAQKKSGAKEKTSSPSWAPWVLKDYKPLKNTFQSIYIIDNQTPVVPIKGTLEFDVQHRFGVINKGYSDFWGFFAPSNIRLGIAYAPINKLFVGIGITKSNMLVDGNLKFSLLQQTKGKIPFSLTYYGNMAVDTRKDADGSLFKYGTQRLSYFNQLIFARKITNKLSVMVAPSLSHQNSVTGFYSKNDSTGQTIFRNMKNDHFAIAFAGRYKVTKSMAIMLNYDQPLTKHNTSNPDPNLAFGIEVSTSSHSFQIFLGNYYAINPQSNNLYNSNAPFAYNDATKTHPNRMDDDPKTTKDESVKVRGGRFVVGFNITRLWNY